MKPRDFVRLLERDGGYCLDCGTTEALAPNHRANRGMGGSKERDVPSNLVVLCSDLNGRIEQIASEAERARRAGWKLYSWQDPKEVPVLDRITGESYFLDDDYGRSIVVRERKL